MRLTFSTSVPPDRTFWNFLVSRKGRVVRALDADEDIDDKVRLRP